MSWPTPQDYVEAIQSPTYAFCDPDLKVAQPEMTKLGLPRVISGQFACVFKLTSSGKAWAVRCFVREFKDSHERYVAISEALKQENFRFAVRFEYIAHGIRVAGKWYPIIKMEWISGQLLGDYIASNSSSQSILVDLANQLAQIHSVLKKTKIAHGDLQHGNFIVNQGKLFLIDYDGMFVPRLSGKGSHEIGHRNYQHPHRTAGDFNDRIDTFSVWIIYLSLIALSHDASLWQRLKCGDDSILFKAQDFIDPKSSLVFRVLKGHRIPTIRKLASHIEGLCIANLATLPSFDPNEIDNAIGTTLKWYYQEQPSIAVPPGQNIKWYYQEQPTIAATPGQNISCPVKPRSKKPHTEPLRIAQLMGIMILLAFALASAFFLSTHRTSAIELSSPAHIEPATRSVISSSLAEISSPELGLTPSITPINLEQPSRVMNRDAKIGEYDLSKGQDLTVIGITSSGDVRIAFDIPGREVFAVESRQVLEEISN